ncbi:D-2-hydroxyacid dehydrogenase [Streptomyces echinatus]|uniref:Phosphoglycerate dehydrogenase-like enzyme n=1 Tax=Streptomyces echinatus TaxID=67293 RepID=A0A7W9UPM7_9ACTN|nr:D-2-hydroxyacid dehydrogenase [Streptomyces echinatus]MBB5925634.1 phosphoglycerate dehydrogenase-like enzyme [Streptomyces echinatus]
MSTAGFTLVMIPPRPDETRTWPGILADAVPGIEVLCPEGAEDLAAALAHADAAYGSLTPELLAAATRLRWLQAPQAGPPPGFYHPALVRHPVEVTNMRDTYTDHVAAHAVALVLALARQLPRYVRDQAAATWAPDWSDDAIVPLGEARVLVVGAGAVGAETGRLLAAFGTRVEGVDPRVTAPPPGFDRVHPPEHLDRVLPQADVVILTVPHTPRTEGLMDAARLASMKRGSCLVNVGRGPTVRLDDLIAVLDTGWIRGAALDVLEREPLPPDHPLWRHPRALITPHVAGAGPHAAERRLQVLVDNARRFAAGQPLINAVDKTQWF